MKTLRDLYFESRLTLVDLSESLDVTPEYLDAVFYGLIDLKEISLNTILGLCVEWKISLEELLQALATSYPQNEEGTIARNMLKIRESKGIDHKTVAEAAGVDPTVYLFQEKGHMFTMSDAVNGMSEALGVHMNDFFNQ